MLPGLNETKALMFCMLGSQRRMMQDPLSPHRVSGEGVSTGDMEDKARGHGTSVQEKTNIKLWKKRRKRAADFRIFR